MEIQLSIQNCCHHYRDLDLPTETVERSLWIFSVTGRMEVSPSFQLSILAAIDLTQLPSYDDSSETCLNLATSLHNL